MRLVTEINKMQFKVLVNSAIFITELKLHRNFKTNSVEQIFSKVNNLQKERKEKTD